MGLAASLAFDFGTLLTRLSCSFTAFTAQRTSEPSVKQIFKILYRAEPAKWTHRTKGLDERQESMGGL